VRLVIWHAHKLCRTAGVPPGDRDDVVAEALLNFCTNLKNAFARGPRGSIRCRYHALNGLAVALRTRRGRPLRLLHEAFEDPDNALAARDPGPEAEAQAHELLPDLLSRLPDERLWRICVLRARGASVAEVAVAEGICVQRVRKLLLRARRLVFASR
jgi:DNA-directed RNA polymerase specialized sigma24 family protein